MFSMLGPVFGGSASLLLSSSLEGRVPKEMHLDHDTFYLAGPGENPANALPARGVGVAIL